MARFTVAQAADTARHYGLVVRAVLDAGAGAGFVLTTRRDTPHVLGVAAVDVTGEYAPVGLDEDEARQLRDALTAWLER